LAATYEKATRVSDRIKAIEKLWALRYDVQIRLSPYIPQYVEVNKINDIKCDKIIVEFLRVN
jgi:DNA repair photolyase